MIKAVLFDLDATLLPMDQQAFTNTYFQRLAQKMAPHGYETDTFIQSVWRGTGAMVKNDGSRTNEEAFWECFFDIYGEKGKRDIPIFEEFYRVEFQTLKEVCGVNETARSLVDWLKERGIQTALATNPLFPRYATESRIRWAGFQPEEFLFYTTYENCHFCKPNPEYYREVLGRLDCTAGECLMVGNDVAEDMVAGQVGMQVFLLTDCLINTKAQDCSVYPGGDFQALWEYIRSHYEEH